MSEFPIESSPEFEKIHQESLQAFRTIRSKHERNETKDIGGRSFILVNAMDADFLSRNDDQQNLLTRLLDTAYGRHNDNRPLHKPGEIHGSLPVFYTLLDLDCAHLIHSFMQRDPPLGQLPIELDKLKTLFPETETDSYTRQPFGQLAEEFYQQQWYWCAFQFNQRMNSEISHHERRIPITARSKIEPTRDGVRHTDPKATLWVVEIPAECVGHDLVQELERNEHASDVEPELAPVREKKYSVVIKQFTEHHKDRFIQEREIFHHIRGNKGIVRYFGWYTWCKKDTATGERQTYYNLVLERGTQDLYSAFQKENPPITYYEVQAFWTSLFDVAEALASIQIIDEEALFTRYVWHGDIKPENILDVQGRFKLADPGEACVQAVSKNLPPPCNGDRILRKQVPGGTRSFAAPEKNTHAVGRPKEIPFVTQGIDIWSLGCVFSVAATYVVAGKEGVKQYHLLRQRACSKLDLGIGDTFHDTQKVLPEVIEWHKYLRTSTRAQDTFTSRVLDIVDNFMLITPGEARIAGSILTSKLAEISEDAKSQYQTRQQPPAGILEFLDDVMKSTVEEHVPALEDIPRTISQSGAEMFEEPLLYRSLRSEGRPPVPRTTVAETGGKEQSFVPRGQDLSIGPSPSQNVRPRNTDLPEIITSFTGTLSESLPSDNPPVTFWEIESQLEVHGQKRSFPAFVNKRPVSVRGKSMEGKDDQLAQHFESRDLIYLVDNASTMGSFWKHASYLLRILVWRSLGYDKDGMELIFTTGDPDLGLKPKKKNAQAQKVTDFTKKMDEAKPKPDGKAKTDMRASLEAILGTHMRQHREDERMKRELTVLVLTDGLWEANDEYDVDKYLVSFISTNKASWGWDDDAPNNQSRRRPISVQFIRFGHHPAAITRLRRLDDELKNRPELADKEIPDMIDTENADGDVYKMFLGSFLEDMDNKLIRGGATTETLSALTPTASAPGSWRMSQYGASSSGNNSPSHRQSDRDMYGSSTIGNSQDVPRTLPHNDPNSQFPYRIPNDAAPTRQNTTARRTPSPGALQRWQSYKSRHLP